MFDWFGKKKQLQKEIAAHYARGRALEDASRYAEAEASYRAAAALDPRHARAHNNVGAMLHMQGRPDEALVWYRKALEIDPAQPEANTNYAELARDAGAHERDRRAT
jgi:Tfp pilus assembly protein PilF